MNAQNLYVDVMMGNRSKYMRFAFISYSLFVILTFTPSASQSAGKKQIKSSDTISGLYETERSNTFGRVQKKTNNFFEFNLSTLGCTFGQSNANGRLSGTLSGSNGKFDDGRGCVVTFTFSKNVMNIAAGAGCKNYCEDSSIDGKWRRYSANPNAVINDVDRSD